MSNRTSVSKSIRVPGLLWEQFAAACKESDIAVNAVLVECIETFTRRAPSGGTAVVPSGGTAVVPSGGTAVVPVPKNAVVPRIAQQYQEPTGYSILYIDNIRERDSQQTHNLAIPTSPTPVATWTRWPLQVKPEVLGFFAEEAQAPVAALFKEAFAQPVVIAMLERYIKEDCAYTGQKAEEVQITHDSSAYIYMICRVLKHNGYKMPTATPIRNNNYSKLQLPMLASDRSNVANWEMVNAITQQLDYAYDLAVDPVLYGKVEARFLKHVERDLKFFKTGPGKNWSGDSPMEKMRNFQTAAERNFREAVLAIDPLPWVCAKLGLEAEASRFNRPYSMAQKFFPTLKIEIPS